MGLITCGRLLNHVNILPNGAMCHSQRKRWVLVGGSKYIYIYMSFICRSLLSLSLSANIER